jgi:chromosome segregation ATPase
LDDLRNRHDAVRQQCQDYNEIITTLRAERDNLQDENEDLTSTLKDTRGTLQQAHKSIDMGAQTRVLQLTKDIELLKKELGTVRKRLADTELELAVRTETLETRDRELDDLQDLLAERDIDITDLNNQLTQVANNLSRCRTMVAGSANDLDKRDEEICRLRRHRQLWKDHCAAHEQTISKLQTELQDTQSSRRAYPPHVSGPAHYFSDPHDYNRNLSAQSYVPRSHKRSVPDDPAPLYAGSR